MEPSAIKNYAFLLKLDLTDKITACLTAERSRGLSERSLKELQLHLSRFNLFCQNRGLE